MAEIFTSALACGTCSAGLGTVQIVIRTSNGHEVAPSLARNCATEKTESSCGAIFESAAGRRDKGDSPEVFRIWPPATSDTRSSSVNFDRRLTDPLSNTAIGWCRLSRDRDPRLSLTDI